ncbi:hypothetical protein ACO0K3_08065 [Undibacterium sp. Rencai35W]|uniref:hypothetical protein n=1 Tax=Undibacterium sp. Rencai35W TaxID=3413046 RepID=UPI003BF247F1
MKLRYPIAATVLLLAAIASPQAQINIGLGMPGISIGINMQSYPDLVQIPGYPVYYAPQANANYFFYDGLYWVLQGNDWYTSSWYDGPWQLVSPDNVPLYMLRVPVRYYRQPPRYFLGWLPEAPPRWGEHWGNNWLIQRRGWDKWNHQSHPKAAPLPSYQQQYSGNRYPGTIDQQKQIQSENYRHRPTETISKQIIRTNNDDKNTDKDRYQEPVRPTSNTQGQHQNQQRIDNNNSHPELPKQIPGQPKAIPGQQVHIPEQQRPNPNTAIPEMPRQIPGQPRVMPQPAPGQTPQNTQAQHSQLEQRAAERDVRAPSTEHGKENRPESPERGRDKKNEERAN